MTVSPAQRAQRRNAGKRSGQVRGGHDGEEPQGDPDAPMPITQDPEVDAEMAAYDNVVGKPMSWPDVKNRVQTRAEIYRTRAAARQDQVDAGRLVTRDVMMKRDEMVDAFWADQLRTVHDLLRDILPPDKLLAAQGRADAWINGVRTKVADQVEEMK